MKQTYIIILAIALGLVLSLFLMRGCGKHKEKKQIEQITAGITDSGKYWKDKYGIEHLEKLQIVGSKANTDVFFKNYKDSISKILNIKTKQLTGLTNTVAELQGIINTGLVADTIHDTIPGLPIGWTGKSFMWTDSFFSIKGYVDTSNVTIFYKGIINLQYTTYWKRKHKFLGLKFGKKLYYIDASSPNKNLHITGLQNIQIN
jgi:hypothetical protein